MSRNRTITGGDVNGDGAAPGAVGAGDTGSEVEVSSGCAAPASFEDAMSELETLVGRMEGGRLPLEESLAAYQRGVVLVKYCRDALGLVAQRVRILEADLLQPFDPVAGDREV